MESEVEKEEREIGELFYRVMENYSDSSIPPLSYLEKPPIVKEENTGPRKRRRLPREDKERERREKLTHNFVKLQSQLSLFSKVTRLDTVNEAIDRIQKLEEEIRVLEETKSLMTMNPTMVKPLRACSNQNSTVIVASSNVVFFLIQSTVGRPLAEIFMVFDKYDAEILLANINVEGHKRTLKVTATIHGNFEMIIEKIKREIMGL